jgi:hypothetical protein
MSQLTEAEKIKIEIGIALDRGESIKKHLGGMIANQDLPAGLPDLITKAGAICLDVEFGPEIQGLSDLKPKRLIVAESYDERITEDPFADFTGQVIKGVSEQSSLPVKFIRKHPLSALDEMNAEISKTPVGLITFLNAYPTDQTPSFLTILAQAATPLLAKGGQLIISTVENDFYTAERLEKSQKLMEVCAQGLSSKFLEKGYGCAGRLFIICQK